MQDTSFAIHPGNKKKLENTAYHDIGNLLEMNKVKHVFEYTCEQGYVNMQFYDEEIVRIVMNPFERPSMKSTFALVLEPKSVKVKVEEEEDQITLSSTKIQITVQKSPFRVQVSDSTGRVLVQEKERGMGFKDTKEVICFKEMDQNDHFYGFGEKTSFLDKRGEKMTMWNSDVYAPHNPEIDSLYESIPYFLALNNGNAYGIFFDNSFKTIFDMKSEQTSYSFSADGGQIDYFVMAGPTPKDVLAQYTSLTGRMPIPPKWALGYHQSRYSYETEQEVRELVSNFLEKEIPVDAIYLDIHYMDGYRVFTFDRDRFPTPDKMVQDLKEQGIHVIPIVDPGVKKDAEYKTYQEGIRQDRFCKYLEGDIYLGEVWPGISAFPDFTNTEVRKWWGDQHQFYSDLGIEGIWNDMNEPAVFNETKTMDVAVMHDNDGDPRTHRELHNLYGFYMGEATYEGMKRHLKGKRPFLLTRAGYSGVQRYAAVWTGDNRSFWEHLSMSLPMVMNLGISGIPFTGPDVGGFAHDTTGELLTRWTQVGVFTPYFRNHSAIETVRQEPWSFGEEYQQIIKKYIQLRYQWLPHLYTLFAEASRTGTPVVRPLFMEYPKDENTYNLSDQFMVGENVIIAPILQPSITHRAVYLPEGRWTNYWTEEVFDGGQHILVKAQLDTLPIFIRDGAILAQGEVKRSTAISDESMSFHLYPQKEGESVYCFYEDDGDTFAYQEGTYLEKIIKMVASESAIEITVENIHDKYQPSWKQVRFVLHQVNVGVTITYNGEVIPTETVKYDEELKRASFTIQG